MPQKFLKHDLLCDFTCGQIAILCYDLYCNATEHENRNQKSALQWRKWSAMKSKTHRPSAKWSWSGAPSGTPSSAAGAADHEQSVVFSNWQCLVCWLAWELSPKSRLQSRSRPNLEDTSHLVGPPFPSQMHATALQHSKWRERVFQLQQTRKRTPIHCLLMRVPLQSR